MGIRSPGGDHWPGRYMVKFLVEHGFKVAKLTVRNVTRNKEPGYPITSHHVLLLLIKFLKNEASWVVIHNKVLWHNFEIQALDPYEFVNHPMLEAYLIKHPSWTVR